MGALFYRLVGKLAVPCRDFHEWVEWMAQTDREYQAAMEGDPGDDMRAVGRHVRLTRMGEWHVSTVFLWINPSLSDLNPMLFETMIYGAAPSDDAQFSGYQTRCATWAEAERMHEQALEYVRKLLAKVEQELQPWTVKE